MIDWFSSLVGDGVDCDTAILVVVVFGVVVATGYICRGFEWLLGYWRH